MNLGKLNPYKSWLISAAIAAAVALWLLSGELSGDDRAGDAIMLTGAESGPDNRTAVRVRKQMAEEVTRTITLNGKSAPARIVEIDAETDGRVITIGADRGDRMSSGEIIAKLDLRDRNARLAQALATVKQREIEFTARDKLMNKSYVSEAQLQEAAAQLEIAKAELARAELDVEYMVIRAPFDGALQDRMVEIGDYVKAGDPVARFVDDRTLIISASVSEFDARHVRKGMPAAATLATGQNVSGTIRYVAPVADEATRTFTVELEVDNTEGKYRGGMTAELKIPAETVLAHKISPSLLTLDDDGNLGVKVVNDLGQVEFHAADIAMSSNEGVWIAGLPRSSSIITVGQGFVSPGATVDAVPEMEINTAVAIKDGNKVE